MATNPPDVRTVVWPVVKAALCLLEWAETTHGNDFGHDHHCPLTTTWGSGKDQGPWADEPGDPEKCTCGWSLFRLAYDEYSGSHGDGPS